MLNLSFKLKNLLIEPAIMNASGPNCASLNELKVIAKADVGCIVTKTTTIKERKGNPEPRYYANAFGSINSMGLPNPGMKKMIENIEALKKITLKPVIVSVAGFNFSEYKTLIKEFNESKADAIEINLSCPNIEGKAQAAYDFNYSKKILRNARNLSEKPLLVKMPPLLDISLQKEFALILAKTKMDAITLINSVGNTLIIDLKKQKPVIKPKKGLGGLGGKYIKPVALGQVWSYYNIFKEMNYNIKIIGVGGIYSGFDAFEFFLAGADAIQIGTAFKEKGIKIFSRIKKELSLITKKYYSLEEFKGKLRF